MLTAHALAAGGGDRAEGARCAEERPELPTSNEMMQRTLEAMRLEAQIAKDMDAYQKRPKRKFVGARAEEYRFARYVEDWRLKVERVGNLNYPEAARAKKLYGSLVLTVSIRADGSIENVEVSKPSGKRILDAAAVRDRRDGGGRTRRSRRTSGATPTSCTSRGPGRSPRATSWCRSDGEPAPRPAPPSSHSRETRRGHGDRLGPAMQRAMGISVHTGWGACVVVGGSLAVPEVVANEVLQILDDSERFCFHRAAEMSPAAAAEWIANMRKKAIANARRALAPLVSKQVGACAIVAKAGEAGSIEQVLASHPRIHSAEGFFFRDVFRDACPIPALVVPPSSLDVARLGKLAPPPWGRDQKLAALAAWQVMARRGVRSAS